LFLFLVCPGRVVAAVELQIAAVHIFRNFDFGTVTLHEKLPDGGSDFVCGPPLKDPQTMSLIDLDGKVYNIFNPRVDNTGQYYN
jgi:hypothetical protein